MLTLGLTGLRDAKKSETSDEKYNGSDNGNAI